MLDTTLFTSLNCFDWKSIHPSCPKSLYIPSPPASYMSPKPFDDALTSNVKVSHPTNTCPRHAPQLYRTNWSFEQIMEMWCVLTLTQMSSNRQVECRTHTHTHKQRNTRTYHTWAHPLRLDSHALRHTSKPDLYTHRCHRESQGNCSSLRGNRPECC